MAQIWTEMPARQRAGGLMARVNVYVPAPDAACHECGWDDAAYETMETQYECTNTAHLAAPSNSPAYLGALAASVQAAELAKLLAGRTEHLAAGKSILISALHHTLDVTALTRNPSCRFDHETWRIKTLKQRPGEMAFGRVLDLAGGAARLAVEGRPFVRLLACEACDAERDVLFLAGRRPRGDAAPCDCGGTMSPVGSHMTDEVDLAGVNGWLARRMSRAGIVAGDILRITDRGGRIVRYGFVCGREGCRIRPATRQTQGLGSRGIGSRGIGPRGIGPRGIRPRDWDPWA